MVSSEHWLYFHEGQQRQGGCLTGEACAGAAAGSWSLSWSRMAKAFAGGVSTASGSPILPAPLPLWESPSNLSLD